VVVLISRANTFSQAISHLTELMLTPGANAVCSKLYIVRMIWIYGNEIGLYADDRAGRTLLQSRVTRSRRRDITKGTGVPGISRQWSVASSQREEGGCERAVALGRLGESGPRAE
jgi:hypothetical protein